MLTSLKVTFDELVMKAPQFINYIVFDERKLIKAFRPMLLVLRKCRHTIAVLSYLHYVVVE